MWGSAIANARLRSNRWQTMADLRECELGVHPTGEEVGTAGASGMHKGMPKIPLVYGCAPGLEERA